MAAGFSRELRQRYGPWYCVRHRIPGIRRTVGQSARGGVHDAMPVSAFPARAIAVIRRPEQSVTVSYAPCPSNERRKVGFFPPLSAINDLSRPCKSPPLLPTRLALSPNDNLHSPFSPACSSTCYLPPFSGNRPESVEERACNVAAVSVASYVTDPSRRPRNLNYVPSSPVPFEAHFIVLHHSSSREILSRDSI